jgi:mannitol-1-phosphate/altronate dehydrogenase
MGGSAMKEHIFTGFGFGPIQGGLFVKEAYASNNFSRIVVAEINHELIDAVRANGGSYYINVASEDRIDAINIHDVEMFRAYPNNPAQRNVIMAQTK